MSSTATPAATAAAAGSTAAASPVHAAASSSSSLPSSSSSSTAAAAAAAAPSAPRPSSSSTGAPSSSSSSSSASSPPPDVDSFLRDLSSLERTAEVQRILASFKLNPLDVINCAHTATREEISKAYRAASLQVHPDKFTPGAEREKAQQAFALLTAAKDALLDEAQREALDDLIDKARQRVLTNHAAEDKSKKRKLDSSSSSSSSSSSAAAVDSGDASTHPLFDQWIRNEVKEIIIEQEWRKRQLLKAAAAEDVLAAAEKARRAEEKAAKDAESKSWEDGRDTRINSWRNFQKGGAKKKMMKPPKLSTADSDQAHIRRPVTQPSEFQK